MNAELKAQSILADVIYTLNVSIDIGIKKDGNIVVNSKRDTAPSTWEELQAMPKHEQQAQITAAKIMYAVDKALRSSGEVKEELHWHPKTAN